MKKLGWFIVFLVVTLPIFAGNCPDPGNSSLQFGEIPYPWVISPFSENQPQAEDHSKFVRANILVAGRGHGVSCTYRNVLGYYSLWWEVSVKIPSPNEYQWRKALGGFECTESVELCLFYAGISE